MNDPPELPLEKILGYLSLEDRLKARAVSRRWCKMINSFRTKTLFFSNHPSGFIRQKRRLFNGPFERNFISSPSFELFFDTFSSSILSSLKHLRLCDLDLHAPSRRVLSSTLNSFVQLEELGLFRFNLLDESEVKMEFKLNLPMLNSIHVEELHAIKKLSLDAPRLRKVKLGWDSHLEIVCPDTVEKLITKGMAWVEVMKFKNLKYLYLCAQRHLIHPAFLFNLKQLKEVHLFDHHNVLLLFGQKHQTARADLKIYFFGLLQGDDYPAINSVVSFNERTIACLANNASRISEEIPFCHGLDYSTIERLPQGSESAFLAKFTDLCEIQVTTPVRHVERFLALLKNYSIVELNFRSGCDQPQDLFDRLLDHCAVEWLHIRLQDFQLLSVAELKNLIYLHLSSFDLSISTHLDLIRRVLENPPPFLSEFSFSGPLDNVRVKISRPTLFDISIGGKRRSSTASVSDVNAAIKFICPLYIPTKKKRAKAEASDQPTKSRRH